jgi:hypothetical protein
MSTYITGYMKHINPATGRIHPSFYALSTETGRMNCKAPNMQNCFDDKTEILTKRGFILFKDLREDDVVAQWEENGKISFVRPLDRICHSYDGELVHLKNQHIDLRMTQDHRCLIQNRRTGKFEVVSAEEYPEDHKQIHAGEYEFGNIHLCHDEVVLLTATQADGYYHDGGIEFSFMKARKYRRLIDVLKRNDIRYSDTQKKNGEVHIRIFKGEITGRIISLLGDEKKWGSWVMDFDKETVQDILHELSHWDGCFTRGENYSSSVRENSDWMQILYALNGMRAHMRSYDNGNPNAKLNWQLDVIDKNYSLTTNVSKTHEPYRGNVYCVSVPSGYIMVRRGGQICITGNCPRKTNDPIGVRNFIKAPDHCLIISCDYSQIELRVGAFYLGQVGDDTMKKVYLEGQDLHAKTTSIVFGVPYEQAHDKNSPNYKEHRTIAKNVNFGVFYGLFPRGLQRTLKFKAGVEKSYEECAAMIENLKAGYPGLSVWQDEVKVLASRKLYTETWLGRRRYLPNINSDDWGKKSFAERCAMNTPIQGTAADILKMGCARILAGLQERPWLKPILQIHDELTFIIPEDRLREAVDYIKSCMEPKPFPEFDLPLVAEASAGRTFGTMKELDD